MMRAPSAKPTPAPQPPKAVSLGASKAKGFHFIVTSSELVSTGSDDLLREQKRQVKSHVSRGRPRRAKGGQRLPSWVSKTTKHQHDQENGSYTTERGYSTSLGGYVGHAARIPFDVKPSVIHDGIQFLRFSLQTLYPLSICEILNPEAASAWVGYLFSDPVYLQAMIFSSAAQADFSAGRKRSLSTLQCASRALNALQKRLDDCTDMAVADPTIMAVVLLAGVAELLDHGTHVDNHLIGLERMIELRGGLEALPSTADELWTKVCRIDLAYSLRTGTRPVFFRNNIPWDAYLPERLSPPISSFVASADLSDFIDLVDVKLNNVWLDLRSLSSMANLAHQSGRKIPTDYFAEIIVSILYRLLHQSFATNTAQEVVRVGMLAYAAAISFQWHNPANFAQKQHVAQIFSECLHELHLSAVDLPAELLLWLLVTWSALTWDGRRTEHDQTLELWLGNVLNELKASSWKHAKLLLKSVMWIDVLHDELGKVVYEHAMAQKDLPALLPG